MKILNHPKIELMKKSKWGFLTTELNELKWSFTEFFFIIKSIFEKKITE